VRKNRRKVVLSFIFIVAVVLNFVIRLPSMSIVSASGNEVTIEILIKTFENGKAHNDVVLSLYQVDEVYDAFPTISGEDERDKMMRFVREVENENIPKTSWILVQKVTTQTISSVSGKVEIVLDVPKGMYLIVQDVPHDEVVVHPSLLQLPIRSANGLQQIVSWEPKTSLIEVEGQKKEDPKLPVVPVVPEDTNVSPKALPPEKEPIPDTEKDSVLPGLGEAAPIFLSVIGGASVGIVVVSCIKRRKREE
jgi:hypothetical protein